MLEIHNKVVGLKAYIFIITENSFFNRTLLFMILLRNFKTLYCLDVFGYKIDIYHISRAIVLFFFVTLGVHCYLVLVFIPQVLVSVIFARITTSTPAIF